MRELPCGCFLNELLEKHLAGENEICRVIACLHRFYESETPTPEIEQWGAPGSLIKPSHDPSDLLAKKFRPARSWMANVMRIDTEVFELCSGNFSQGYDLLAPEQF